MSSFADAVDVDMNERTDNGMKTNKNTGSKVLNFFGKAGSSRGKDLTADFLEALHEDEDLALRALQWTRDIRGGSGERQQFRTILQNLDKKQPAIAARLIHKIPLIGRFDDLFVYENATSRRLAFELIKDSLDSKNGLCAKWMPRKGDVAVELTRFLKLDPKQYRRLVVDLTDVVETKMCAKEWDLINFSTIPSVASARYQKAFGRNAKEKYAKYLLELEKPEDERDPDVKINAGAVYPYDIIKSIQQGNAKAADAQWEALPNYIGDSKIIPIVDVSGSMMMYHLHPSPMDVAVSLGLYVSEKNTSVFKDMFMTFSAEPEMIKVTGTLSSRMTQMMHSRWGMNTNLHKAFDRILHIAKNGKVSQEDMPDMLLILSDMQFDVCISYDDDAQGMIKRKFDNAGYVMPKIVFWNLSRTSDKSPVKFDDIGVCHISGFSPAIMKVVLSDTLNDCDFTPYNVMLETLNVERYNLDVVDDTAMVVDEDNISVGDSLLVEEDTKNSQDDENLK